MKTKMMVHLLLYITYFLLPTANCSEEPSALSLPLPIDLHLEAARQSLLKLGVAPETVAQASDAKLRKWGHFSNIFPMWDEPHGSEVLDVAKCELSWFLDIVSFEGAAECVAKHSGMAHKLDEKLLVNMFADRHAFELGEIVEEGGSHVEDEVELRRHAKDLVSLESVNPFWVPLLFLQHSLRLLRKSPDVSGASGHV